MSLNKRKLTNLEVDSWLKNANTHIQNWKREQLKINSTRPPYNKIYHFVYLITNTNVTPNLYYIGKHSTSNLYDAYISPSNYVKREIVREGIEAFTIKILKFFPTATKAYNYEAQLCVKEWVGHNHTYNYAIDGKHGYVDMLMEADYFNIIDERKYIYFRYKKAGETQKEYENHLNAQKM